MKGRKPMLYNTNEYKRFIESMANTFMSQRAPGPPIEGPVAVYTSFSLARKNNSSDVDAYNKQILDALEHGGVYNNDNQVKFQATINAGTDREGSEDVIAVMVIELGGDVMVSTDGVVDDPEDFSLES